jgi:hypothetical protein
MFRRILVTSCMIGLALCIGVLLLVPSDKTARVSLTPDAPDTEWVLRSYSRRDSGFGAANSEFYAFRITDGYLDIWHFIPSSPVVRGPMTTTFGPSRFPGIPVRNLSLLFGAASLTLMALPGLRRLRRRRRNECVTCGYSLIGNTSGRCPECGRRANRVIAVEEAHIGRGRSS